MSARAFFGASVLFGAWAALDVVLAVATGRAYWLVFAVLMAACAASIWHSAKSIQRSQRSIAESNRRIAESQRMIDYYTRRSAS